MNADDVARRVSLTVAITFLGILAWGTIAGGIGQLPRVATRGQGIETGLQLACGVLSVLVVLTRFRGHAWSHAVRVAWIVSLAATAGLSALVWGPPQPAVALVFVAGALVLAWGALHALGPGHTESETTSP